MEEQNVQTNNIPPKNKNPYTNKSVKWGGRFLLLLVVLVVIGMIGDQKGWFKKGFSLLRQDNAIENKLELTDYVVPEGTVQIESHAFEQQPLRFIFIPRSVKSIGACAFLNCTQLELVVFESGSQLLNIGDYAFAECVSLKSIIIPEGVQRIGFAAFRNCGSLDSVTIPDGVKEIQNYTFSLCQNLKSVIIPNSVTYIGDYAFEGCCRLKSFTIPNSVTHIGDHALDDCGLTSVNIPNSVTSIGDYAFCDLKSVTLPNGVTSIGYGAFSSIHEIHYNGSIQEWFAESWSPSDVFMDINDNGNRYYNSYKLYMRGRLLQNVEIPNTVTYLSRFSGCGSLISVTIPNSVTSIGWHAFRNCFGLTSVTIPNSVTSIGGYAFRNCTRLTSVTIPNSVTCIGREVFDFCTDLTLRVPEKFKDEVDFSGCKEVIYY